MADRLSRNSLQRIAEAHNIPSGLLPPRLQRLSAKDIGITPAPDDEQRADTVINQHKTLTRKPSVLKTKKRLQYFKFKTVTEILPEAVKTEDAAVVQLLLQRGGDASVIKDDNTKATELAKRSALLLQAIGGGQPDTIRLLASQASQSRLDEALTTALTNQQEEAIRILLQFGADPNHCRPQFLDAASKGDTDCLGYLLSAPVAMSAPTLADALLAAVSNNSVRAVVMIAETEALTQNTLEAVSLAVSQGRFAMLLTMLLRCTRLNPDFLGKQVLSAYKSSHGNRPAMIRALFSAGASGNDACAAFALAVEQSSPLVGLFADNHVDINWGSGKAVRKAVRLGRSELVKTVMSSSDLTVGNANRAMEEIPRRMSSTERLPILTLLLDAGAHGTAVDDQLVFAVQDKHEAAVSLLRSRGASLEGNDGDALLQAIRNGDLGTLQLLLQGTLSCAALQQAFPHLRHKLEGFEMTRLFLAAGVSGDVVHAALRDAVLDHKPQLIDLLIDAHADPSFAHTQALRQAVADVDVGLLQKLLRAPAGISRENVSLLVPLVQRMSKTEARLQMTRLILHRCTGDDSIARALIQELSDDGGCHNMVELLVTEGNANVNIENGKAVKLAAANETSLRLLMASSTLRHSSVRIAIESMLQSDIGDEMKASRSSILLGVKKKCEIAYHGVKAYVEHCQKYGSDQEWPLATFRILLNAKPDLNVHNGEVVLSAVQPGALSLMELIGPTLTQPIIDKVLLQSQRLEINALAFTKVLLRLHPSLTTISTGLVAACRSASYQVAEVLLRHGARVNHQQYGALRAATFDISILRLLLTTKPSETALAASFDAAIQLESSSDRFKAVEAILKAGFRGQAVDEYLIVLVDQSLPQLSFISLLLDHGASVNAENSRCIRLAATSRRCDALMLLWPHNRSDEAASLAFDDCVRQGLVQLHEKDVFNFLLTNGGKGQLLNYALDLAVDRAVTSGDMTMVVLLLSYGSDPNSSNGQAICHASKMGHLESVKLLTKAQAKIEVRVKAMLALIQSNPDRVSAHDFCLIAQTLTCKLPWDADKNVESLLTVKDDSPIRQLLRNRCRSVTELKQILEIGYRPAGADILHWAMTTVPRIKTECVQALIEHGANAGYIHESSTMIMIAIQTGRDSLIKPLLQRGADPSAKDSQGRSPLILSVEKQSNVTDLVEAAVVNDGSLHQAVRCLNPSTVVQLLERGHSPMLPSPFHGHARRTPLAELMSINIDPPKYHLVQQIIELLKVHGADLTKRFAGKPLICLALDNSPHAAAALLQVMHQRIDEDFNMYKNDAYCYSPTSYVVKGICRGARNQISEKLNTLRDYGAERDVFYALSGPQPDDATGMPLDIERAETERRAQLRRQAEEEEEHRRKLQRIDQLAARTDQVAQHQHQQELQRKTAEEQASRRLIRERHELHMNLDREKWSFEGEQETRRQQWRRNERQQHESHQRTLDDMEVRKRAQMNDLEQSNQRQLLDREYEAARQKATVQKQLASDIDARDQRKHERRMKELQMETARQIGWESLGRGQQGQRVLEL